MLRGAATRAIAAATHTAKEAEMAVLRELEMERRKRADMRTAAKRERLAAKDTAARSAPNLGAHLNGAPTCNGTCNGGSNGAAGVSHTHPKGRVGFYPAVEVLESQRLAQVSPLNLQKCNNSRSSRF